jgi:deazaflavin-dependent oxidoreductase (nitroreductase family)
MSLRVLANRAHAWLLVASRGRLGATVVVSSNGGRAEPLAWSRNLAAEPLGRAFVDRRWVPVQAEVTRGDERARLWEALSHGNPWLARAAARAGHDLPVIVLRPLGEKAAT